jgi:hypothetical protein
MNQFTKIFFKAEDEQLAGKISCFGLNLASETIT